MNQLRNIWEFYSLIERIEGALAEADESVWAERLKDAVAGGATSGEILSRVGIELSSLLESGVARRAGIEADVVVADQFVSAALGSS